MSVPHLCAGAVGCSDEFFCVTRVTRNSLNGLHELCAPLYKYTYKPLRKGSKGKEWETKGDIGFAPDVPFPNCLGVQCLGVQ